MRPKSGLPKRRAIRSKPIFEFGFRDNPATARVRKAGRKDRTPTEPISVLSLFSGCGGMDLGFLGGFKFLGKVYPTLPFHIVDAIDIDAPSVETYNLNIGNHSHVGDLTTISPIDLPKCRVLIGGFPCQDFSSSGPKVGLEGSRGQLYRVLVSYMKAHQPEIVIGENVAHLARLNSGKYLETILSDFEACGYKFNVWNLYGPDYGLPQSRRRLFLVGVRNDIKTRPVRPIPTHANKHVAIEEAIEDLKEISDESVTNQSQYFVATRATSGGGQGDHTNRKGEPAYCIRANAKARIQFHYELDRRLTVRECARLQSFPDEFVFPFAAMTNMSQIGNAVPPMLAHKVATAIYEFMKDPSKGEEPAEAQSQRALFTLQPQKK